MRLLKSLAVIVLAVVAATGCVQQKQQQTCCNTESANPLAPSTSAVTPVMASLRYSLYSATATGRASQLLEGPVAAVGNGQSMLLSTTLTAGQPYVFRYCAETAAILSANQQAGRWVSTSASSLKNGTTQATEYSVASSSPEVCVDHGFRPDMSGEVFTTTLEERGGVLQGTPTTMNHVAVRAR